MTNVWVNLLDNAIKYSNEQLIVEVETIVDDNGFIVKIKDNGIGMSATVRKRIFDKFYRESSGNVHNVKGHGLGLAYVKQIVNMHSGTISVSSIPKPRKYIYRIFTVQITHQMISKNQADIISRR